MHLELRSLKIFDLHCDTFSRMYHEKLDFSDCKLAVNINSLNCFNNSIQTFAVWLKGDEYDLKSEYENILSYGLLKLKDYSKQISVCKCRNDLTNAKKNAKISALLSLENGACIDSAEYVDKLYCDGIRTLSLTWNDDNLLAGGAKGEKGLTSLGSEVILRMNKLGMVLDLSHLNRKSFFQAIELADNVVATHSGVDCLVSNDRNLTDEQLKAIFEKHGVIGLCFYPEFIGQNVYTGLYNAVYYFLNKGYENILSIGSDFDGARMCSDLSSPKDAFSLREYFLSNGIEKNIVDRLFYKNAENYYLNILSEI